MFRTGLLTACGKAQAVSNVYSEKLLMKGRGTVRNM